MPEILKPNQGWKTMERPGYLGKRKEAEFARWNQVYGVDKWRLVNETSQGEILSYNDIIWKIYIPGYTSYFFNHHKEAIHITENYCYAYDKDMITKEQAFNLYALYNKSGIANQFHHVAFNIALEWYLGLPFKGIKPLQVREGKPGTPISQQPKGHLWSPGRIPSLRPDLIPQPAIEGWWAKGSIEDFYQSTKALQIFK